MGGSAAASARVGSAAAPPRAVSTVGPRQAGLCSCDLAAGSAAPLGRAPTQRGFRDLDAATPDSEGFFAKVGSWLAPAAVRAARLGRSWLRGCRFGGRGAKIPPAASRRSAVGGRRCVLVSRASCRSRTGAGRDARWPPRSWLLAYRIRQQNRQDL